MLCLVFVPISCREGVGVSRLQRSRGLVTVLGLLADVDIRLVTYEEFVSTVFEVDAVGVELIGVTKHHAVEISTHECSDRVGGAVGDTAVEHSFVVGVYQSARHIATNGNAIGAHYA